MASSTMTAPGTGAAYDQDRFDAHNEAGPSWLRDWRRNAFRDFESLPLPTTALEEWRYTDPKRLKWDAVGLAPEASTATVPESEATWLRERTASGRVLQVGTHIVQVELDEALRAKGVILSDLMVAAEEHAGSRLDIDSVGLVVNCEGRLVRRSEFLQHLESGFAVNGGVRA